MSSVVIITATGRRFWFEARDRKEAARVVASFRFSHRGEVIRYAMFCMAMPEDIPFDDTPPVFPPPRQRRANPWVG